MTKTTLRGIVADLLGAGGLACLIGGTWWIWPPLGLVVLGAVVLAAGVLVAQAANDK